MWTRIGHGILDSQQVAAAQMTGVAEEIGTRETPGTTACLKAISVRGHGCALGDYAAMRRNVEFGTGNELELLDAQKNYYAARLIFSSHL